MNKTMLYQCECGYKFNWSKDEQHTLECPYCHRRYIVNNKVLIKLTPVMWDGKGTEDR